MKNFSLSLLLLMIGLVACRDTNTSSTNTTTAADTIAQAQARSVAEGPQITDFEVIPKVKVGPIRPNFDQDSLVRVFGAKNVQLTEQVEGENVDSYMMTVIYPNTKDQLFVRWMKGQDMKKIESIRIESENSAWHTPEGIKVGTTLEELVQINGKEFKFFGFEWDYSGMTNQWDGGKINKLLTVTLDPINPEAIYEGAGLSGKTLYSSANPLAKKAKLRVLNMVIKM